MAPDLGGRRGPKINELPSVEILNDLFELDAEMGELYWKNPPKGRGHRIRVGDLVGYDQQGYLTCRINGHEYKVHRIIFKMFHGREPGAEIDHIDRDKQNNRPDNLREASRQMNNANRGLRPGLENLVGVSSVPMAPGIVYFKATLWDKGKMHDLGTHRTPVDAARAYNEAAIRFNGELAHINDLEAAAKVPRSIIPGRPLRYEGSLVLQGKNVTDRYDI